MNQHDKKIYSPKFSSFQAFKNQDLHYVEDQEQDEDNGFSEEKHSLQKEVDFQNLEVNSLQNFGMRDSPIASQGGDEIYNSDGYGSNNNDSDGISPGFKSYAL